MSKKLLFILIACALCVGMIGSSFAYFTDVVRSTGNTMTAGTLTLGVSLDNLNWANANTGAGAVITSPSGWAPGTSFTTAPIFLKDTGTIDAQYVFGTICQPTDSVANFSNQIAVTAMSDYIPGYGWEKTDFTNQATLNSFLSYWGLPLNQPITLADLWYYANPVGGSAKTGFYFYNMFDFDTTPWLAAGTTDEVTFTFELLPTVNNTFQGASTTFEIDFTAAQTTTGLDGYITQTLGPYSH